MPWYFCFSYLISSLAGYIIVYTPSQRTNGKVPSSLIIKRKIPTLAVHKHLFCPNFSLIRHVYSIFRWKLVGPNTLETDIKVLIPASTIKYQQVFDYSVDGRKRTSSVKTLYYGKKEVILKKKYIHARFFHGISSNCSIVFHVFMKRWIT